MIETLSTPLGKRVIQLLQRVARNSRVPEYAITARELLAEIEHPAAPLRYDIERAALDAYSEVQAERNERGVFRNADHRAALMAAIDAVDKLRGH